MRADDLSVVMPNYNHARYLPRAVAAVLDQSVRPAEVIVMDDGSTDDSWSVLTRLAAENPRLTVVRNERNLGVIETVNRGVQLAKGTYVVLPASDDYLLPGMIEKSLGVIRRHPDCGMSCGTLTTVDADSGKVEEFPTGWCEVPAYLPPDDAAVKVAPGGIPSASAIYRREALIAAGGYLPDLKWASDWFLNLVLAFRHGVCHVPEPLAHTVVRAGSYSTGIADTEQRRAVLAAVLAHALSPAYADVLPLLRASGVFAGTFGPDVVRVAAARPDRWTRDVLAMIDGVDPEPLEALLADPDAEVRALADHLLGSHWRRRKDAEVRRAAAAHYTTFDELRAARETIAWMESSKFWKARRLVSGAFGRNAGKTA